jgi:hypothetical protein
MAVGFGLYWRAAARVDAKRARTAGIVAILAGIVTIVLDVAAV